jgi:hypothetical protein
MNGQSVICKYHVLVCFINLKGGSIYPWQSLLRVHMIILQATKGKRPDFLGRKFVLMTILWTLSFRAELGHTSLTESKLWNRTMILKTGRKPVTTSKNGIEKKWHPTSQPSPPRAAASSSCPALESAPAPPTVRPPVNRKNKNPALQPPVLHQVPQGPTRLSNRR